MNDLFGKALLDYQNGHYTEDLFTETTISEQEELPLPYLFRSFDEMPPLEQIALSHCKGKVLDVGCGAGSHSLYLQKQGLEVHAIDTSEGAIEVATKRGVRSASVQDILQLNEGLFDTILLMMNGTGIFQDMASVPKYLKHLKSLLHPKGQIIIDSSDILYMYPEGEHGGVWVPGDCYYGELEFLLSYKNQQSEPFPWLYIDEERLTDLCAKSALNCKVIAHGEHYDYLAKITY